MSATTKELPTSVKPGDRTWVQLSPYGEFPQTDADGKRVVQVVDEAAANAMASAFADACRDVLVDADHGSENGGSSEAYAWIQKLEARDDGLWAAFRWTDKGAEAVSARRYRFVSPAWMVGADGRPSALASVALVNNPNILSRPILNSAAGGSGETTKTQEKPEMDKLKEMLGLAADADDAAILAAVEALQARVAEMEEKALNAEAEAFAEEHKDKCDKTVLANAYKASPDTARDLVLNIKTAPAKAPAAASAVSRVLNSQAPVGGPLPSLSREEARAKLASLPASRRKEFYDANKALIG